MVNRVEYITPAVKEKTITPHLMRNCEMDIFYCISYFDLVKARQTIPKEYTSCPPI